MPSNRLQEAFLSRHLQILEAPIQLSTKESRAHGQRGFSTTVQAPESAKFLNEVSGFMKQSAANWAARSPARLLAKKEAPEELSENAHTVKGRQRKASIEAKGELFAQLERVKRSENQALNRAKKKELYTTAAYQQAGPREKEILAQSFKEEF